MIKNVVKYACVMSLCIPSYGHATAGIETNGSGTSKRSAPSVNNSANQTKDSNSSGEIMSYVMSGIEVGTGGFMISEGMDSVPPNGAMIAGGVMMVGMGLMSAAQGAAHGNSKDQAGNAGINTDGFGILNPNGPSSTNDPLNERDPNSLINKDPSIKAAKATLAKLQQQGIYDPKAGTLKVGDKAYKVSDFASADSMAAAGLPKGAIDGAMDMNAQLEKKAQDKIDKLKLGSLTNVAGFDEGGGGKSGKGSDDSSAGGSRVSYAQGVAGKAASGRDPSSLAGMQKNYNGEPIGVAGDDIFLMMNRRYKVKESQESFLTDAEIALHK
ncbi:MAG: hypothetical protein ACXVCY_00900 [Pseudobdellovibrionaceae bacterium]